MTARKPRQSGIELVKILAIFLVVLSHVTQTLFTPQGLWGYAGGAFWDLDAPAADWQHFALLLCMDAGVIGNGIFFLASAWFLCGSSQVKPEKFLRMELNVWSVSVLVLLGFLAAGLRPGLTTIIPCCFPTLFSTNWYITCYLMLYLVHPYCNRLIYNLSKRDLLGLTAGLVFCYVFLGTLSPGMLFSSQLIVFLTLYFMVACLRQYPPRWLESARVNLLILAAGCTGVFLLLYGTNWLNTRSPGSISPMRWYTTQNFFNLMIAFSLFQLFRRLHFTSRWVNRLSGLSLLIYLLHDNILFKVYLRPLPLLWIFQKYGYGAVFGWVLLYALVLFAGCALLAGLYQAVTGKLFGRVSRLLAQKLFPDRQATCQH